MGGSDGGTDYIGSGTIYNPITGAIQTGANVGAGCVGVIVFVRLIRLLQVDPLPLSHVARLSWLKWAQIEALIVARFWPTFFGRETDRSLAGQKSSAHGILWGRAL